MMLQRATLKKTTLPSPANGRGLQQGRRGGRIVVSCMHQAPDSKQQQYHDEQKQQRQQQQQQHYNAAAGGLAGAIGRAGAAALAACVVVVSQAAAAFDPAAAAAAAAPPKSLAAIVAPRYPALAGGDDVSPRDLEQFEAQLWLAWLEEGRPLIGNGDPDFCRKLFDLNQDGKLTSEEVLRSLAINDAVNERAERARDAVYRAFDRDGNGAVDEGEWLATLGDLGPNGDAAKRYIFSRVDQLSNSDGQLDPDDFASAMVLARDLILGGGPSPALVAYERGGGGQEQSDVM